MYSQIEKVAKWPGTHTRFVPSAAGWLAFLLDPPAAAAVGMCRASLRTTA